MLTAGGVLTQGHAPPESLEGMLSLAKPGAMVIFSMSSLGFENYGFGRAIRALEDAGAWREIDRSARFKSYPYSAGHGDLYHWVWVYRKGG